MIKMNLYLQWMLLNGDTLQTGLFVHHMKSHEEYFVHSSLPVLKG